MNVAIKIDGGSEISIVDCKFVNWGIGVHAKDMRNLLLKGNDFEACGTAVKAEGVDGLIARENTNNSNRSIREKKVGEFPFTKSSSANRKILSADALKFCIDRLRESST